MTNDPGSSSQDWRWRELASDVEHAAQEDTASEWPHPDYAVAAGCCLGSREDLCKLYELCSDMEMLVGPFAGVGPLERLAGVERDTFKCLIGCCWREVLVNTALPRRVWLGLHRLGVLFRSKNMDAATRRTAAVIQLIARVRLDCAGGHLESAADTVRFERERQLLSKRPYLPLFVRNILDESGR